MLIELIILWLNISPQSCRGKRNAL